MFLSCTTAPVNWGTVFDLEIPSWLLLDFKLCIILFIIGDTVCFSLRYETQAGFSVIVLVGKLLKGKVQDTISFGFKLIFCSLSVVSFFLMLLEKSYPFSFAFLTSF